jgi:hypothetical protein
VPQGLQASRVFFHWPRVTAEATHRDMALVSDVTQYVSTPITSYTRTPRERRARQRRLALWVAIAIALAGPLGSLFFWPLLYGPIGRLVVALLWLAPAIVLASWALSFWTLAMAERGKRLVSGLPLAVNVGGLVLWFALDQWLWGIWLGTRFTPNDSASLKAAWQVNHVAYNVVERQVRDNRLKADAHGQVVVPRYLRFPLAAHARIELIGDRRILGPPILYFRIKDPGLLVAGWETYGYLYSETDPSKVHYFDPIIEVERIGDNWYIVRW